MILAADPAELGRKCAEAIKANKVRMRQYAYRQYVVDHDRNDSGKETGRKTTTWEIIGLEGSSYKRLVQRNDKALDAKEQKHEDDRLKKETALRRSESPEQKRHRLFSTSYSLRVPLDSLNQFFNLSVKPGEEWVLVADPKENDKPRSDQEREYAAYRFTIWLDPKDGFPIRTEGEVVGEHARMQKGSHFELTFEHLPEGTWVPHAVIGEYRVRVFKAATARASQEVTFSDYHMFQTDSHLVEDKQ
jgi:hypothetical protein